MDPTLAGPEVVAAYRAARRAGDEVDPGTEAMQVAALMLAKVDRMPCTARDFLGENLYRRAAKIAGWPTEGNEAEVAGA